MAYLVRVNVNDGSSIAKKFDPPIAEKLRAELALGSEMSCGDLPPLRLLVEAEAGDVPDIIGWNVGPFILSARMRGWLERLEPNVHQFVEVTVVPMGTNATLEYCLVKSPPRIDPIIINESDFRSGFGRKGYDQEMRASQVASIPSLRRSARLTASPNARCTIRRSLIEGRHFWRLPERFHGEYMCSDALHDRIASEKVRGWEFSTRCSER